MARWSDVEAEAPALAALARRYLDARAHKTLATLRADGSPRISGTESLWSGGDLWFGSMPGAVKALDLRRDGRFALHSGSEDPPGWTGDAKVAGRVEEVVDPERRRAVLGGAHADAHLFRAELTEVSVVRLGEPPDHLVVEVWSEGRGVRSLRRD